MRLSTLLAAVVLVCCRQWQLVRAEEPTSNAAVGDEPVDSDIDAFERDTATTRVVRCILLERLFLYIPTAKWSPKRDREEWTCEFIDEKNVIRKIQGLPRKFFKKHKDQIQSGATELSFSFEDYGGGVPVEVFAPPTAGEKPPRNDVWAMPPGTNYTFQNIFDDGEAFRHRRMAIRNEGAHSTLIIRVTDSEGLEPTRSANQLREDIFGGPNDKFNLNSQYAACSGGKLTFVPASGTGIVNGVMEITVPRGVEDQAATIVENWVTVTATTEYGDLDQWDLVLYILPGAVNFNGAAAYTYVGAHHSVYLDRFSDRLLVQMHEVGHNFLHRHSGEGGSSYGDNTCMMGAHLYEDEAPRMCFNGAKSWHFGWYSDRHATFHPYTKSWDGHLVGIDDYLNDEIPSESDAAVVVRLRSTNAADLFLLYNRKEGVNNEVQAHPNMVTVVEQDGRSEQSWLLEAISEHTDPYIYENWNGGAYDLVIRVCKRVYGSPDYARVIIYLDDGAHNLSCPQDDSNAPPPPSPPPPSPGTYSVNLVIETGSDEYRQKDNGVMTRGAPVHHLFEPNWNKQAFRFEAGNTWGLPALADIVTASLLVTPTGDSASLGQSMNGYAVGHDIGYAPGYSEDDYLISQAPKTAETVVIDRNPPAWKSGHETELVDVAPIVQEIVNRPDYVQQNPIEIFLIGNGQQVGASRKIKTMNDNVQCKLRVTYTLSSEAQALADLHRAPTVELSVKEALDDYRESSDGPVGAFSNSHLIFSYAHDKQAYRFQNSQVPKGAEILQARLEMMAKTGSPPDSSVKGFINGEDVGDSPPFEFGQWRITEAAKTQARVHFNGLPVFTENEYSLIADVSPVLQEIVDRNNYAKGNAIKIFLNNKNTTSAKRVVTYDSDPNGSARLIVRYRKR